MSNMNNSYIIGGLCGTALAILIWGSIIYCAVHYNHIKEFIISASVVFIFLSAGVIALLDIIYKSLTE